MTSLLLCLCILHIFVRNEVTGSVMTITPTTVTLNAETSVNQTLRCSLTADEQNTLIKNLLVMKINRFMANGEKVAYAIISSDPPELGTPSELLRLGATVNGRMQNKNDAELVLAWNSSLVQCQDASIFECEVSYLDSKFNTLYWVHNGTLSVQTISLNMVVSRGGLPISPSQATMTNPMEMTEGQTVTIECTADVGNQATRIDFHHTRPFDKTNEFQNFSPGQEDQYTEGQPTSIDCGFRRVTTLHHNITKMDVQRDNLLAFRCGITYTEYSAQRTKLSEGVFFRAVSAGGGGGGRPANVASAGSGNAGAIAGGVIGGLVLIVLIVLLVYFLWYRRRGDGETYRTKEETGAENPNMVPSATVNSVSSIDKKGYINSGLDEPHQERSRHRNNYSHRGRANYGMERDDEDYNSRDGSPTMTPHINHMASDPHGSIGTGV